MRKTVQSITAIFLVGSLLSWLFVRPAGARGPGVAPLAALQSEPAAAELQLALSLDPAAAQPGETVTLSVLLTNSGTDTRTPEVAFSVPEGVALDPTGLPPGTAVNLQANGISWFPVVAGGTSQPLALHLETQAVDMNRPVQTVSATVIDQGNEQTHAVDFWVGVAPTADIVLTPAEAAVGQPVQLIADIVGPGPLQQRWHLGDGRYLETDDPLVVYSAPGTYSITLEVANPLGTARVTSQVVVAPGTVSSFSLEDKTPGPGQEVRFVNLSGGQPPLSFLWDFGDGTQDTATNPTHRYAAPGNYEVTLVTSNTFGVDSSSWTLFVGPAPEASLLLPAQVQTGLPLIGQVAADASVASFSWDMGDGTVLDGPIVSHSYPAPGDYYVTVAATNPYSTTVLGQWVSVVPGAQQVFLPLIIGGMAAPDAVVEPDVAIREVPAEAPPLDPAATPAETLLWYINEARRIHDLPPLEYNYELSIAAQQHSADMAVNNFTGHTGTDNSRPPERQLRAGYRGTYAGEATAWGFSDPVLAVEFWVNSPSHRPMILDPDTTDIGIGTALNYGAKSFWYWTVEFGVRRPSTPPSP